MHSSPVRLAVGVCHDENCCSKRQYEYTTNFLREIYGFKGNDSEVLIQAGRENFTIYLEMDKRLQPALDTLSKSEGSSDDIKTFVKYADRCGVGYIPRRMGNIHFCAMLSGSGISVNAVDSKGVKAGTLHSNLFLQESDVEQIAKIDYEREIHMANAIHPTNNSLFFVGYLHVLPESFLRQTFEVEKLCPKGAYPHYIREYSRIKQELS